MPRVLAAEGLARERDVARREQRGHDALAEPEVRAGAIDLVAVKATVFGSVSAQRRTSGVGVWGRGDQWFRTLNIGSPCRVAAGAHPAGQVNACDASSAEPCLMLCGRPSAFSARGSMVVELVELVERGPCGRTCQFRAAFFNLAPLWHLRENQRRCVPKRELRFERPVRVPHESPSPQRRRYKQRPVIRRKYVSISDQGDQV